MATTSWSANSEVQPSEYEANTFHDEQPFWLPYNVPHELALTSDLAQPISTSRELFLPDNISWLPGAVSLASSNNHEAGKPMHFSPLGPHDYLDHSLDGQLIEPVSPLPRKELLLQCKLPDCAGQQSFTQRSAFKRHMDRHERPFVCLEQSCNKRAFLDKGTLQRHQHSVHSRAHIYCPLKSCRRNSKGFARKDNLREHMKRTHPTELLHTNVSIQRYGDSPPDISAGNKTRRGSTSDVSRGDGSMEEVVAKPARTGSVEAHVLEAKLRELKAERARRLKGLDLESLDSDIMAVERTLKLVTSSPSLT